MLKYEPVVHWQHAIFKITKVSSEKRILTQCIQDVQVMFKTSYNISNMFSLIYLRLLNLSNDHSFFLPLGFCSFSSKFLANLYAKFPRKQKYLKINVKSTAKSALSKTGAATSTVFYFLLKIISTVKASLPIILFPCTSVSFKRTASVSRPAPIFQEIKISHHMVKGSNKNVD